MANRQTNLSILSANAVKVPPTTAPAYSTSNRADYRNKKMPFKMPTSLGDESGNFMPQTEFFSMNS